MKTTNVGPLENFPLYGIPYQNQIYKVHALNQKLHQRHTDIKVSGLSDIYLVIRDDNIQRPCHCSR
jgi:hypothetical protein